MAKAKSVKDLPKSPDYKMAEQSLMRSNVLGMLGNQSRTQQVLQGAFSGMRKLRRGGTEVYGYSIKKPKGDPGWKNPYG